MKRSESPDKSRMLSNTHTSAESSIVCEHVFYDARVLDGQHPGQRLQALPRFAQGHDCAARVAFMPRAPPACPVSSPQRGIRR